MQFKCKFLVSFGLAVAIQRHHYSLLYISYNVAYFESKSNYSLKINVHMHIQCWKLNLNVMNKSLHVSSLGLFIVEHLLRTCAKVQFFQIVGCKKKRGCPRLSQCIHQLFKIWQIYINNILIYIWCCCPMVSTIGSQQEGAGIYVVISFHFVEWYSGLLPHS